MKHGHEAKVRALQLRQYLASFQNHFYKPALFTRSIQRMCRKGFMLHVIGVTEVDPIIWEGVKVSVKHSSLWGPSAWLPET
jgi:hypothetical protein